MKILARTAAAAFIATLAAGAATTPVLAKSKACAIVKALDPDNDGTLTADEAKAAGGKVFDRLNKDKDATLDRKELKGRLSRKEIAAGDPDKDSTIDKAEYLSIVEARFKAANGDADATIDCKELNSKAGRALLRLIK